MDKRALTHTCPVCTVTLSPEAVLFATGFQGTRAQLYARVCQYTQDTRCLNQDETRIGEVLRADGFPSEQDT